MTDPDFREFPVQQRVRAFGEFAVGQTFQHHWGRTLTEADSLQFSTATCHWSPMYVNREFSRAHGHQDLVVNPFLILCTAVGLSVEDLSEAGGGFLGMNDVRFICPSYPGDTISVTSTVEDVRESNSRPDFGIVSWKTIATNQRGEVVLELRRTNLVSKLRSAA